MGWTYKKGATRDDILCDLTKSWESPSATGETLVFSLAVEDGMSVLWAVQEYTTKGPAPVSTRLLVCCLLENDPGYGWGYKLMSEEMGPFFYSCPVSFFDMVPDPGGYAAEWRAKVKAGKGGKVCLGM